MTSSHGQTVPSGGGQQTNGDEFRWPLYTHCPDAIDRLNIFYWEWIADTNEPVGIREWVKRKNHPVSVERGINDDGLFEAAETVAAEVQRELRTRSSPLEMSDAVELWLFRCGYLNALIHLGGNAFAKEVDARVARSGQPLTICVGSNKKIPVMAVLPPGQTRTYTLQGFGGCRRVFPDPPSGPGRRWPRWCPECRTRKSNARNAAEANLRRRIASIYQI